jgi:hypothetical protein
MRVPYFKRMRALAGFLAIAVVLSMAASATGFAQQPGSPQQQPPVPAQPSQTQPSSTPAAPQAQTGSNDTAHPAGQQEQSGTASPLGTAAAPKQEVTGVMGSRPAGAAIAPAKQRRVRTIFIKIGAVVGAAVALGTVAALSKGSPSRPH